jgi:hypothetical protein
MIYVFCITIIYTFVRQRKKLLQSKKNMALYLLLSVLGLGMGVVYLINPYLPSISVILEKYME